MRPKHTKETPMERGYRIVDKYLEKMTKELGQKDMYYIIKDYARRRDSKYWKNVQWDMEEVKKSIRTYGREDMCTQCMDKAIKVIDKMEVRK